MTQPPPLQPPVAARRSRRAVLSIWLAGFGFVLGPLTSIPAIVLAHRARREILGSPSLRGMQTATIGLTLGYCSLAVFAVVLYVALVAANVSLVRDGSEEVQQLSGPAKWLAPIFEKK